MQDVIMRPITGREEIELFNGLPYLLNEEFEQDLENGRRRPEWMWVALRGERLVGRAAWWAPNRETADPRVMDVFDLVEGEPDETGLELFRTASRGPVDFVTFTKPDWREDPQESRAVETRLRTLGRTGAKVFVERIRLEWRPGTAIAPPSRRLVFRPIPAGDDELIELMARVLEDTLDAHSRRDLQTAQAEQVARDQYHGAFLGNPKPREWWRVATTPDGEPVGFVVPARNAYGPIIAYLGVVPEHRGKGYIDDILAEGTRIIAAHDGDRVRATTDITNVPMAKSFARNGYRTTGGQINMTWG